MGRDSIARLFLHTGLIAGSHIVVFRSARNARLSRSGRRQYATSRLFRVHPGSARVERRVASTVDFLRHASLVQQQLRLASLQPIISVS